MIEFLMSYRIPILLTFIYMVLLGLKGDLNTIVIIFWPLVLCVMGIIWVEES